MKNFKFLILTLAIVFFFGGNAYSQKDSARGEKLRKVVREKLIEKIGVDESTADKLIEMTAANRKEMKDYRKRMKELTEDIFDNPKSSDVGSKLDELMELDNKINKARNDHYAKLKSFLTPAQIAQTMVFQKELMKFMKKEMKRKDKGDRDKNGEGKYDDKKRKKDEHGDDLFD